MAGKFRFDFPSEVVQEREEVFKVMRHLLSQNTLSGVQEACRLQLDWLRLYPDDAVMIDAGEVLGKSHDALLVTTTQDTASFLSSADEQFQAAR